MASTGTKHDFLNPPQGSEDHLGTLGHYRVIDELGKGGMGFVFLAEDTRLKRDVALKVMNQKIASTPGSRKRFISEARSMASVHHDNVATIFEVGEYKGTPFMAMELLEGSTLENYWEQKGEPDFHVLIAYARDIARGLAAAHAQGIVHRDIKPANIWLDTKTNRIKILDFGLALAQTPVDQLSGRGAVVGTPGYLSPEQARSEPLDDRSDLYSTGVVLYELATGSLPLKSKTVAEQLIAILVHAPKPVRQRNENIPQPLADLIHKLMAKEPRDRYRNAVELEQALDKVEVECESKTEVAQAINKLQLGLEQAVNKKNADVVAPQADLIPTPAVTPNPFEMLPDVLPAATPIATGVSSSGVHAAIPLASGTAGGRSSAKKKKSAGAPLANSKVIWIAVGVGAVLLLLLIPAIVFLSDSSAIARQQNQPATVVGSDPVPNASSSNSNSKPNDAPVKPKSQPKHQPKPSQNKPSGPQKTAATPVTKVNAKEVAEISTPKSAVKPKPKPKPAVKPDPSMVASQSKPAAPPAKPVVKPTPKPATSGPKVVRKITIKTTDEYGADATVKRGSSINKPLGLKPTIVIQTRKNIQVQHVYMRFPLTSLRTGNNAQNGNQNRRGGGSTKAKPLPVITAQLQLTLTSAKRPGFANVRVYGLDQANSDSWPESKIAWSLSLSRTDGEIEKLPLLAELKVAPSQQTISVSNAALAKFVANSKHRSITLILTGSTGNELVTIASKEASGAAPPTLVLGLSE